MTVAAGVQWVLGRVRLGGGLDLGYAWMGRAATSVGPHIGIDALDAFALATFDVIDLGDHRALYPGVRPSGGLRWGESFFAFGPRHRRLARRGAHRHPVLTHSERPQRPPARGASVVRESCRGPA